MREKKFSRHHNFKLLKTTVVRSFTSHQSLVASHRGTTYHFNKSISSPSNVSRFLKNEMMMPSPTAASAAASVIIKMANTWPSAETTSRENATRLMFTAFSINSMDIKMMMTLRRVTTPMMPIVNKPRLKN